MDSFSLARALHVLAIVHWIGGVSMVTLVLLPGLRRIDAADRLALFERVEGRFGAQAKVSTLVAAGSGLWMAWQIDAWPRFIDPASWWMLAMVLVWALFSIVLFVAEPLFLHRWFRTRAAIDPDATFALVQRFHFVLLGLSAITVSAAVLGAHGGL